jgi:outer membrane protein assembly factor BamD (BamD/ComL family)
MKKKFVYFVMSVSVLISCSSPNGGNDKAKLIASIDSIQKNMFNAKTMQLDKNLAFKGINAYKDFVKKFPDDSIHSAEYLFRLSDLSRGVGDNRNAILYLGQITKTYPTFKKIPECIFLQGYYYQEFFADTTSAKIFYNQIIEKYPSHPFANDAKELMKMFGKSEADIIKGFEKKEQEGKKK